MPPTLPVLRAEQILEQLDQAGLPTFAELVERLYAGRYTGAVTLHFSEGMPKMVEFTQPVQVKLARGG